MIDSRFSTSLFFLLILLLSTSSAFNVVPSSPCRQVCDHAELGDTAEGIVCLDREYTKTTNGTNFKSCVECQLGSTAVDQASGVTDVKWALYHLRYALSTCIFGIPTEKVSISTPCQVSCAPLQQAITSNLEKKVASQDLSFCGIDGFNDNTVVINRCAACYSRMDQEAYLANFMQSLHIACLDNPDPSQAFPVAAGSIFNTVPIPTPTPSPTAAPSSGKPANLTLIIVLPSVLGFLVIAGVAICCYYSARHRRRIMAGRDNMSRVHDKMSPTFSPEMNYDSQFIGQAQSPGLSAPPSAYYSPDQKINPYSPETDTQSPERNQQQTPASLIHISPQPPPQPQFPFRTYSPADYAQHQRDPGSPRSPTIDTSVFGPGPDQKKDHSLHDAFFPPPPPNPPPASLQTPYQHHPFQSLNMPPAIAEGAGFATGLGIVERLDSHQRTIPNLALPTPKKSLDASRAEKATEKGRVNEGEGEDGFQLQNMTARPPDMVEQNPPPSSSPRVVDNQGVVQPESPQVFYFDPASGRYRKQPHLDE